MLTRQQLKRQRAAEETARRRKASRAQSLSASLLTHLMRFLDDFRTLSRMQSVCIHWRSLSSAQLDLCWRPLYLRDWEPHSAINASVLSNGDAATPWKDRYRKRHLIETNWDSGRYRFTTIAVATSCFAFTLYRETQVIAALASRVEPAAAKRFTLGEMRRDAVLLDLDGAERTRWHLGAGFVSGLTLNATGTMLAAIGTACITLSNVSNLPASASVERRIEHPRGNGVGSRYNSVAFCGALLIVGVDDAIETYDPNTGHLLHSFTMSNLAWSIDTALNLLVGIGTELVLMDAASGTEVARRKLVTKNDMDLTQLRGAVVHPAGGAVLLNHEHDSGVFELNYAAVARGAAASTAGARGSAAIEEPIVALPLAGLQSTAASEVYPRMRSVLLRCGSRLELYCPKTLQLRQLFRGRLWNEMHSLTKFVFIGAPDFDNHENRQICVLDFALVERD